MSTIKKGRPRKDGSIPWVVSYVDTGDPKRTDRIRTFDTFREAKAFKITVERGLEEGTWVPDSSSCTMSEACDLWLGRLEKMGGPDGQPLSYGTLDRYRCQIRLYVKPLFDDRPLSKWKRADAEDYCERLMEVSPAYNAGRVLRVVRRVVDDAQRRGVVGQNVFASCKIPIKHAPRGHEIGVRTPTEREMNLLLDNAQGRLRPMLFTAAHTGLRSGELRALTWDDHIDFNRKTIRVRQAVKNMGTDKSRRTIGGPKNKFSLRDVPMPDELVLELKEWRLKCPRAGRASGRSLAGRLMGFSRIPHSKLMQIVQLVETGLQQKEVMRLSGASAFVVRKVRKAMQSGKGLEPGRLHYVFPDLFGEVLHSGRFDHELKALQVSLGIVGADGKAKYSAHSTRHFYASWLARQGVVPVELKALIGHARLSTVTDMYTHAFAETEERATKVAASMLALRSLRQK